MKEDTRSTSNAPVSAGLDPGTARRHKGRRRVAAILAAARELLIAEGTPAFSLRNVAARAGIQLGNLQYYFRTKQDLVHALLDDVARDYVVQEARVLRRLRGDPRERFLAWLGWLVRDARNMRTQRLFVQLWALVESVEGGAADLLNEFYAKDIRMLEELIGEVNPALSRRDRYARAALIAATVEGTMVTTRGAGRAVRNAIEQEFRNQALRTVTAPPRDG